ncbi:MAG: hypothetical protein AAFP04_14250, partial [Myxococcota bacterium]
MPTTGPSPATVIGRGGGGARRVLVAGMGLRFIQLDDAAKKLAHHFQKTATNTRRAPPPPRPITVAGEGPVVGIDLGTVNSCVAV